MTLATVVKCGQTILGRLLRVYLRTTCGEKNLTLITRTVLTVSLVPVTAGRYTWVHLATHWPHVLCGRETSKGDWLRNDR